MPECIVCGRKSDVNEYKCDDGTLPVCGRCHKVSGGVLTIFAPTGVMYYFEEGGQWARGPAD
jgi:hypothetical protein